MKLQATFIKTSFSIILSLSFLFVVNTHAHSQSKDGLYCGIAKINITPEKSVKMAGYGERMKGPESKGVHDSLYARAVAFEKNGKRLLLVSTDLIYVTLPIRDEILNALKLEPSELFLTSIHTHAGPTMTTEPQKAHPNNLEYIENLTKKLITIVREAIHNMKEVKIGVGVGYSPIGINRRALHIDGSGHPEWSKSLVKLGRNPTGTTDKEVLVMKIANSEGAPIGILFDYAVHGTCLKKSNLLISGDILGLAAQFVEKIVGDNVIAPVFAGASGDINPYMRDLSPFGPESGWIPEHVLQGTMLGEEVVRTLIGIKENLPAGMIKTDFVTIELPGKEAKTLRNEGTDNLTNQLNITAACIGDIGFIGFGCELATEIGITIKAASPFKYTFVITHCNGTSGYLCPEYQYREGGYEIETSRFAPGAAEIAMKKALDMLYSL